MYDLSIYDEAFFTTVEAEAKKMAPWLCTLVMRVINPIRVMDIGCGTGAYVERFTAVHPVNAWGMDGSLWAVKHRLTTRIMLFDLRYPWTVKWNKEKGLTISIETAEHIEGEHADTYVDTLCNFGETVCMTAAPPGQGGLQHVNEQPQSYWIEKFQQRGYTLNEELTTRMKDGIRAAKESGQYVTTWFEPNMMVFTKDN